MSLDEAAARGRRLKQEQRAAAKEQRREQAEALSDEQRTRLDRVYGIDAGLGPYGIYLMVLGVISGVMTFFIVPASPTSGRSLTFPLVIVAVFGVIGVLFLLGGNQVPKSREAEERWLRERPFAFDSEGYKRSLRDHDHLSGWLRVSVRFAKPVPGALRGKFDDAAVGLGAAGTMWPDEKTVYIRSEEFDTTVSNDTASYNTARKLHVWFRQFATEGLPVLLQAGGGEVEKVTAKMGRWSNGSWECEGDDDDAPDSVKLA